MNQAYCSAAVDYHFGVYGAYTKSNSLLTITKARGPYKGLLDLPGGTPEAAERPLETLCREVAEETGLLVLRATVAKSIRLRYAYTDEHGDKRCFWHQALLFRITDVDEKGVFHDSCVRGDASGVVWADLYPNGMPICPHLLSPLALSYCIRATH